ncbi:MAG: hypothetical protein ACKVQU_22405 [Burkholderiales bacterium]
MIRDHLKGRVDIGQTVPRHQRLERRSVLEIVGRARAARADRQRGVVATTALLRRLLLFG